MIDYPVRIVGERPDSPAANTALRAYYTEIVERYHNRPTTDAEIDEVLTEEPSDDLRAPTGAFWVANAEDAVVGCVGLRLVEPGLAEVTRVHVAVAARRQGLGSRLLETVERHARELGVTRLRLDTRSDLVEARALYARHGYREVPRFNDSPYAGHWFVKDLA